MKRLLSLALVFCCMLLVAPDVLADAKLSVNDKALFTFEGEWNGYFFAKLTNTGDTGCYVDVGKLVGFDADDNVIISESYISTMPSSLWLEPGEYAYVRDYVLENELKTATVADYKFSIKPDKYGTRYRKISCKAKLSMTDPDAFDNAIEVAFTNPYDDVLFGYTVTAAIFDGNGSLIFVNSDSYSRIGVAPGSTVTVLLPIDRDMTQYFSKASITPAEVDAVVYVKQK